MVPDQLPLAVSHWSLRLSHKPESTPITNTTRQGINQNQQSQRYQQTQCKCLEETLTLSPTKEKKKRKKRNLLVLLTLKQSTSSTTGTTTDRGRSTWTYIVWEDGSHPLIQLVFLGISHLARNPPTKQKQPWVCAPVTLNLFFWLDKDQD